MQEKRRFRSSGWWVLVLTGLSLAPASARDGDVPTTGTSQLAVLAPYVAQVLQVAALDPVLAASLVPDAWIDSLVSGALALEAEVAEKPSSPDPMQRWPIGPWSSPDSLAHTIETVDSRSAIALFRALRPRLTLRCGERGASPAVCDRAMRTSASRLSARSVLSRALGGPPSPITPTQRELARLGVPVVMALRDQLHTGGRALWGASWSAGH